MAAARIVRRRRIFELTKVKYPLSFAQISFSTQCAAQISFSTQKNAPNLQHLYWQQPPRPAA